MEAASRRSLSRAAATLALILGQSLYYARHWHDSFNKQTFPGGQLGTRDVAVTAVDMTALSSHLCLPVTRARDTPQRTEEGTGAQREAWTRGPSARTWQRDSFLPRCQAVLTGLHLPPSRACQPLTQLPRLWGPSLELR